MKRRGVYDFKLSSETLSRTWEAEPTNQGWWARPRKCEIDSRLNAKVYPTSNNNNNKACLTQSCFEVWAKDMKGRQKNHNLSGNTEPLWPSPARIVSRSKCRMSLEDKKTSPYFQHIYCNGGAHYTEMCNKVAPH